MRVIVALPFAALVLLSPAAAQTIYRYDRGDILAAATFDFKVEFPGLQKARVMVEALGLGYGE